MIYIREAHPADGWVSPRNTKEGINIADPKSHEERSELAAKTCSLLKISLPCLVDSMNDTANKAYAAWPDRLCIVGKDGRIALMGEQGPKGFKPSVEAARQWLHDYAAATAAPGASR